MALHLVQTGDPVPQWTFGDRLRKVRRTQRLTQVQMADALGMNPPTEAAWEADRNLPRDLIGAATLIEDTFGLPRGWMLGYADIPAPRGGAKEVTLPHLDSNQEPADSHESNVVELARWRTSDRAVRVPVRGARNYRAASRGSAPNGDRGGMRLVTVSGVG